MICQWEVRYRDARGTSSSLFRSLPPSLSFARLAISMGRPNFVKILSRLLARRNIIVEMVRLIGVIGMMIGKSCETRGGGGGGERGVSVGGQGVANKKKTRERNFKR